MIQLINSVRRDERGVVSIFIVLFAAIFMTVITVSFLSVMTRDQQQATTSDLSQNAYDSAMAGVEDAKRAIVRCQTQPNASGCEKINSGDCTTLSEVGVVGAPLTTDGNNQEYPLQQSEGDNTLNQAYTCVSIDTVPGDYRADLTEDTPLVIPLQGSASAKQLNFSWTRRSTGDNFTLPISNEGFFDYNTWRTNKHYPAVMRLELIHLQGDGSIKLSDLDTSDVETVFLYPQKNLIGAGATEVDFATDVRQERTSSPIVVDCDATTSTCSARLRDGNRTIVNDASSGKKAITYLVMMPLYDNASVSLTLPSGIHFSGLQAVVDSTGRANDLFRRVQARVDLIPHPVYPNAALSLTGPLCKNFMVTPSSYTNNATAPGCN